jgi:hypothetical protein
MPAAAQPMAGNAGRGESGGDVGRRVVEKHRDVVIVAECARGGESADIDRVEVARVEVAEVEDEPVWSNMADGVYQDLA